MHKSISKCAESSKTHFARFFLGPYFRLINVTSIKSNWIQETNSSEMLVIFNTVTNSR